jgi:nanoRNase/pAp phosphatase (c-di-AMP/oligoRNAs hydrolase)
MAKERKEDQILSLFNQASAVLIALPFQPTTDAIASGLALLAVCEKLKKRAKIVSFNFQLPANHGFLPKSDEIFDDISSLKKFIISLDLAKASVEELSYEIQDKHLNIFITPKEGNFTAADVKTSDSDYAFDLVITLDAKDLESLGQLYEKNAEFFYNTPIVNIDHTAANDHFGQVNLVNVTATSTSEVIFEMFEKWPHELLDEYIATNLLTGMISKTKSFQAGSVTPRSLAIASHLIDQGARRDEIVKHLYQSKSVSTLKLWGKVLSGLQADTDHDLVWSHLTHADLTETNGNADTIADVIDELIINTPDAKNVVILYEDGEQKADAEKRQMIALVSTAPFIHAKELFADFAPKGSDHFVTLSSTLSLKEFERVILDRLRTELQKAKA